MGPEKEEGVFEGEGPFGVDPVRALEILRSRQLAIRASRLGLWIRAAVLRNASFIRFSWAPLSLTIRFDGRPFSTQELADPFSELLAGRPSPEARWFALALLHTTRAKVRVRVESGPSGGRRCLLLERGGLSLAEAKERCEDNIAVVRWPLVTSVLDDPLHPYGWDSISIREALEPCPLRVEVRRAGENQSWDFRPLPPDPRGFTNAEVRQGALRLLLRPGAAHTGLRIRPFAAGVALEDLEALPFPIGLDAWAEDPKLSLDASLRSPVRNAKYRVCVRTAQGAARSYVFSLLKRHERAMRLAGRLIASCPDIRRHWSGLLGRPLPKLLDALISSRRRPLEKGLFARRLSGDSRRIKECAALTSHLRAGAAASLRTFPGNALDPLKAALWKAPLFFNDQGGLLSLQGLQLAGGKLLFEDQDRAYLRRYFPDIARRRA
ncbi:MAG: hypothetical protein HY922_07630 [Elusimicrobia bacterium]|nr:hypothetical protein [Elusimicrobiota bacterium]